MKPSKHARNVRKLNEARKTLVHVSEALCKALVARTATQADLDRVLNAARHAFALQKFVNLNAEEKP